MGLGWVRGSAWGGLGGAQGTSIGQGGLSGALRVLSRARRAQQGLGFWLGEGSGVDSEGTQGGLEVARGASVVGGAGGARQSWRRLSLRGVVKGARLGCGSRLVSTRSTHLLTVRHRHPLEYPQGRIAHRHPLLLPAGHNADRPGRACGTMATNPATPPRSGWPRGASIQQPAARPPARRAVTGRTNRPSRALPSSPRSHWPPPPRPRPLVGRALPDRKSVV